MLVIDMNIEFDKHLNNGKPLSVPFSYFSHRLYTTNYHGFSSISFMIYIRWQNKGCSISVNRVFQFSILSLLRSMPLSDKANDL